MEFVIVFSLLIFIGFCAAILCLAISNAYGKQLGEKPVSRNNQTDTP